MNPLWIPQLCGGVVGPSFTPADFFVGDYTGDEWDPNVTAKLWTDAGITQVASDGDVTGRWTGNVNANQFNQTTAGSKPTWQTAELNGYPVVRGDGTDDFMSHASFVIDQTLPCTVLAIAKQSAVDDEVIVATYSSGGDIYKFHSNAGAQEFRGFAPLQDKAAAGATVWGLYAVKIDAVIAANSTTSVWVNGGSASVSASGARIAQDGALTLFALPGGGSQNFGGDLAHLVIVNKSLSLTELNNYKTWANARFGLSCSTFV